VDATLAQRQFRRYFANQATEALLRLLAVAALAWGLLPFTSSAQGAMSALTAAAGAAALASIALNAGTWSGPAGTHTQAAAELRRFLPVAAAIAVLQTLGGQVELFVIHERLGSEHTALFDGARRLAMILPLLGSVAVAAMLPHAASLKSPAEARRYALGVLKFGLPAGVLGGGALALAAETLLPLCWGAPYSASAPLLKLLAAAYALQMVLQPLLLAWLPLQRNAPLIALHALALVLNLGFCWAFTTGPQSSLEATGWAALLSRGITMAAACGALAWALRGAHPATGTDSKERA
jgi:O-antigen/teichoic acid export membrane protein